MNRKLTQMILAALLAVGMLGGCGTASDTKKPEETPKPAAETQTVAERVRFTDINEGDRIILVSPDQKRAVSTVSEGSQLLALAVTGNEETLTYVPEGTGLFTCESGEDGSLHLKTEDGYLTAGTAANSLVIDAAKDTPAFWTLSDSELSVRIPGAEPEERQLYYNREKNHFGLCIPGDISDERYLNFRLYRVNPGYTAETDDGSGYRLTVFETSDLHGHIAEATEGSDAEYRLAWIAGIVQRQRNSSGTKRTDTTILLDGGDFLQGGILSNLLKGDPISEAMDIMEYDAAALGNHEFDWGIENVIDPDGTVKDYQATVSDGRNKVPMLVSNLFRNGSPVSFTKDYVILNKTAVDSDGNELPVKIGVIGFAENYASSIIAKRFSDLGFEIREDYEALSALAEKLKQEEHCDAVILLTHANAAGMSANLNQDQNIDLVLGGHTHISDYGRNEAGKPYAAPAGSAEAVIRTQLVFDTGEDGQPVFRDVCGTDVITPSEGEAVLPEGGSNELLDKDIVAVTDKAVDKAMDVLDTELGYITESVICHEYFPGSGERGSTGGNFYTSLVRRAADADIAFFNRYGMREDLIIPEGKDRRIITLADIYMLFPFEDDIVLYRLSMEDLLEVFNYALTSDGKGLLAVVSGITCYYTGRTVNALVKDGEPVYIHGVWQNGHEHDTVTVAVQDFLATSNRNDGGMDNPLYHWYGTDRMISDEIPSQANFIRLLEEEADANDGHLEVSDELFFIEGDYPGN